MRRVEGWELNPPAVSPFLVIVEVSSVMNRIPNLVPQENFKNSSKGRLRGAPSPL